MANRYWVGGTATWDGTAGTKWSTTSGGAGGASVPTSSDDVYFDQNSNVGTGAFTVTISSARVCRNITVQNLDGAMTLAGSGSLSVYGNLTFPSTGLTVSNTGTFTIRGQSSAVNTGGVLISNVSLGSRSLVIGSAVTESVILTGSLNVSTTLYIACNLNTQGFTIQATTIQVPNYVFTANFTTSNIYTASLRSTNATTTVPSGAILQTNLSNLTILNSSNYSIAIIPIVLNSLTILNNTTTSKPFDYVFLWSDVTTNDLIVPEPASERLYISLVGNLTVNNNISITLSSSSIKRVILASALEINGIFEKNIGGLTLTAVNTDFYGITVTAPSVDCTRCGDLGFNNGIDFDESRTLYWSGTNSDVWSASKWSTVSGQSGSEQYPLAQDNVILDNTSSASTLVIDKCWAVKNLDASTRSMPLTLSDNARGNLGQNTDFAQLQHYEQFLRITGNLSLSASINFNGTSPFVFLNSGVHNINASYLPGLGIDTHSGVVRLVNNLNVGTNINFNPQDPPDNLTGFFTIPRLDSVISIASGIFDTNKYTLEATKINSRLSLLPHVDAAIVYAAKAALNNPQEKMLKFDLSEIRLGKTSSPITGDISLIDEGASYIASNILRYCPHFDIECTGGLLVDVSSTSGQVSINATRYVDVSAERNPLPRIQLSGLASTYDIKCSLIEDISSTRSSPFSIRITNRDSVVYVHNWSLQGSANGSIALSNIGDSSPNKPSPLTKTGGGIVQADYLNISNSTVQPPNTWYAGANSVNAGNNINWIFANPYDPETSGDFFIMLD